MKKPTETNVYMNLKAHRFEHFSNTGHCCRMQSYCMLQITNCTVLIENQVKIHCNKRYEKYFCAEIIDAELVSNGHQSSLRAEPSRCVSFFSRSKLLFAPARRIIFPFERAIRTFPLRENYYCIRFQLIIAHNIELSF